MKQLFQKDSFLKIISFVIAILLWFYIIAVVDPSVNITVKDISIRYSNQSVLEEKGLCLISDPDARVELKISGSRKKIANIDNKNIYATVDLANTTKEGTFSLPISISIPYEYNEIISKKPYNAEVVIDKVITAQKEVKILTTGSVANGYVASDNTVSVKTVVLKGASSQIAKIGAVALTLDYDNRSADIKDTKELFFLGTDGKAISKNDPVYDYVSMDIEKAEVESRIYKLKTVPVKVDATATAGVGSYKINVQPSNITIFAENEILDTVDEIFTKKINLDSLTEDSIVVELDLPDGVRLRDGIKEVTVKAEKRG